MLWTLEASLGLVSASLTEDQQRRWNHVLVATSRANSIRALFPGEDAEVLCVATALHDIGYSTRATDTGFHALDGARFLACNGAPDRICALVAHHSCAYREAELRGYSAELAQWADEHTPVRDALWWADMTTGPNGEPTNAFARIEEITRRYGPGDLVTLFVQQARPELVAAVERTEARLKAAGIQPK